MRETEKIAKILMASNNAATLLKEPEISMSKLHF